MNGIHIEFWQVLVVSSLRYFVFAGIAYLIFYVWKKHRWSNYKIQSTEPGDISVDNELTYSMITLLIFAGVIYLVLFTAVSEYTRIYMNIYDRSGFYYIISLLSVILLHDTYFYWTHRLMHWRKIFRYVHRVHHRSHNPTPLAAFSFHPLEAIVEIGILPLIVFLFPVHRSVIALFSLYMLSMNVIGHLGFEFFPKRFVRHKLFRWFNSSTHHNMHHHYGKGNYGLYFNLWDRLLGTNHPDYEKEFERVVDSRDNRKLS